MYVIKNDLPYVLIGFPQCKNHNLNTDCVNIIITQNNKIISVMTNNIESMLPKTLYVSSELCICQDKIVNECDNDTNMTQNTQSENDFFSEFRTMNNNYQTISESETNLATNKTHFISQNFNHNK